MLTQNRLKEVLHYETDTGHFLWKERISIRIVVGRIAGNVGKNGYREIKVFGLRTTVHRLAFFYMTGEWPPEDVDHINGNRDDNRWLNLRLVSRSVNLQNRHGPGIKNTTGFLGVSPSGGKYLAQIRADGCAKYLGRYSTPEEAHAVYVEAKRKYHAGCTI